MSFHFKDIQDAYMRIRPYVRQTLLEESYYLKGQRRNVFFKLESLQKVKSFKIRGAFNRMLCLTEKEKTLGVTTISSGNHGISVSYAASVLDIEKAVIIVPETTPQSKIDKIKYYGADVRLMGKDYDEAHALGEAYIIENELINIDSYDRDELVYAGQGTIAVEILEQNSEIDTIVVPIGGGGLITGVAVAAKAMKPDIRVIGVQTEACPAMIQSYSDGICHAEYPSDPSLCDALIGGIGSLSYEMAHHYVDEFLAVSEESIGKAVSFMAKKEKLILEPGSATTAAAIMEHGERIRGKNVALVISGANIDGDLLTKLLHKYP